MYRFPLWDAYFVLAGAGTAAFIATAHRASEVARGGAEVLLAGLVLWYLGWGRPLMRANIEDWRGYVYFAGVLALYVPAVALAGPGSTFAMVALCPQAYMVLPVLPATGAVVLLNAGNMLVTLARTGDPASLVPGPLTMAVTVVVGSAAFGTWARRVVEQNDERARLIEQLNETRAEVARLSHEAGVTAERQRLAGDIHDTVAQGLSSVVMLIQAADAELDRDLALARRHLGLALRTARDNLAETRALVGALTPAALTGSTLADALARLVDRFGVETGVRASFTATGLEATDEPLSRPVEVVLLRAAQESLTNVRKHAGADAVSVGLHRTGDTVTLEVTDDGVGLPDDTGRSGGYGLNAMRARVEQVSGELTVDAAPGRGTTVRLEVPVR
jgi:signal transduction histidine kinase